MASGETTPAPRITLAEGLRGTDNAFGVIRLVLATLVIFSHAFYLGGPDDDPSHGWTKGQETIGGFAVVGFFAVSGYLITKSGTRNDIVQFLWRRCLRIFPAFWGALLVGAAIVGPLVWVQMGRSVSTYFVRTPGGPFDYLQANWKLTMYQWGIHDIFAASTPWGTKTGISVFNGSLWTLAYEWRAYLVIAVLVLVGALRKAPVTVLITLGVLWTMAVVDAFHIANYAAVWPGFQDKFYVTLTLAFMIGSAAAAYAHRIVLDGRAAIVAGVAVVVTLAFGGWVIIGYAALTYVLMFAAARLPGSARRIGQRNDYSYGMYVYGFLVQQLTASWGWNAWGYWPWVAATVVITGACAFLSWHVLEKRALALKDWGPGRGIPFWRERASRALAGVRPSRRQEPAEGSTTAMSSDGH